ncbi:MAG: flagellar basal-body rod protein FlgG [Comamonas sp.]|nr:flagellar basal-body rod protein FlgG [Comamonas sp.]
MMSALWIAKTGMSAQQKNMDVVSHNLSNISTTGYKRQNAVFQDLMYQNMRQVGSQVDEQNALPTGMHVGMGVRTVAISRSFAQGTPQETNKAYDIAINGAGFFQVQMPDGSTTYTRDGSFSVNGDGTLVTASGYPLLDGITVPPESHSFSVSKTGVVTVIPAGGTEPEEIGQITLANFINPAGLEPVGENLYLESPASGAPQEGAPNENNMGYVMHGFLEASNVNVVQELVDMIQTQRAYEMNSKAVTTSDQMLGRLAQI